MEPNPARDGRLSTPDPRGPRLPLAPAGRPTSPCLVPATAIATSTPLLLLLASIPALGFAAPAGHGGYSLVHSERASVSLGPRRMEPVPAATATAAPPGCSDLRGELHALALGEEEGQGLVANLRRKRYLFYSFETLSVTCTRRSNT